MLDSYEEYINLLRFYLESGVDTVVLDSPVPHIPHIEKEASSVNSNKEKNSLVLSLMQYNTEEDLNSYVHKNSIARLSVYADHTFFGYGVAQAKLCILLSHPLRKNDENNQFFLPNQKIFLNTLIALLGFEENEVYYAYTVFYPPVGNSIFKEDIEICIPYVERLLDIGQYSKVLVLSEYFYEYVLKQRTLLQDHGQVVTRNNRHYFLGLSFHNLIQNVRLKPIFWEDIKRWKEEFI